MEINGKKVVVIGGASGMGRASAELLHERGADVAILDREGSDGKDGGRGRRRHVLPGRRHRLRRHRGDAAGGGRQARRLARHHHHRRRRHRQADADQDRSARPRVLPIRDRPQPRSPPSTSAGWRPRTWPRTSPKTTETRCHHQHRFDRGLRGPDRAGRLHRRQGGDRRHVPDDGPRPGLAGNPGAGDRAQPVRHGADQGHSGRVRHGS